MIAHNSSLPSQVTVRDVLVYARDHGLISRQGDRLVLADLD
jgi:hypothetical protein